jgi:hypothetical protein
MVSIFQNTADMTDMTEEQRLVETERVQRLREKNRMDALMAKQRIQSYKVRNAGLYGI